MDKNWNITLNINDYRSSFVTIPSDPRDPPVFTEEGQGYLDKVEEWIMDDRTGEAHPAAPYLPDDIELLSEVHRMCARIVSDSRRFITTRARALAIGETVTRTLSMTLAWYVDPVRLRDISPSGGGIRDREFQAEVREFMDKGMNGFDPTDLGEDGNGPEGWGDPEEWEFETSGGPFEVIEVEVEPVKDEDASDEEDEEWAWKIVSIDYKDISYRDGPGNDGSSWRASILEACENELSCPHGEEDPSTVYVIVNTDYAIPEVEEAFIDEDDAENECDGKNREHAEESGCGFPWAWNYSWAPESDIHSEDLIEAGFKVGTFRDTRYCGIDGGGYDFESAHFSKLMAIVHERWERPSRTVQGYRRVMS